MSSHPSAPPPIPPVRSGDEPTKRTADYASLADSSAQKRKRPQSCDTCRSRKIKCVRLQLDTSSDSRCVQCRAIDAKCTFDYIPKRPGPQSSFAKTAKREAAAQAKAHAPSPHSRTSTAPFIETPTSQLAGPSPHHHSPDDSWYRALAAQNFASGSTGGGGAAHGAQTRSSSWSGAAANLDAYLNSSMLAMTPSHFAAMSAASPFDFSPHNMASLSGPSPAALSGSSATPGSYAGSSSWHAGAPRSDAGSSRTGGAMQQQQAPATPSIVDHMHSFEMAGLVGDRSTPLPLPIPSFSRVQSPVPSSASLPPQVGEQNASLPHQQQQQQQQQRPTALNSAPSIDAHARSSTKSTTTPRSLDDIAPRQTLLTIISLYFHYLWPLLPIVDRPSFSHDLLNRRDERDATFLAFCLSLVSYTLIQCPPNVIPAPASFYRKLHRLCHTASRALQPRTYDPPQLLHVSTLYCDHIYLGTVGKINAADAVLAEAVRVAFTLGLHDERSNAKSAAPYSLDASSFAHYSSQPGAVEVELRRRVFWVLHGSSTTIAMLQDEPALIHAMDACVELPRAVEEEALTDPEYRQSGEASVLSGFLTVTRLHQVMLELLESYRRDRRFPVDELAVARSRMRYLKDVLRRVAGVLEDMPEGLRRPTVEGVESRGSKQQGGPLLQAIGFDAATQTALGNHVSEGSNWPWPAETFTRDGLPHVPTSESGPGRSPRTDVHLPKGPSEPLNLVDVIHVFRPPPPSSILSPMSTMHANIVATESLIRFLVTEYRELISCRIRDLSLRHPSSSSPHPYTDVDAGEGWQESATKLLQMFGTLPLDALASNGQSLVDKIIYVVRGLLNRSGGGRERWGCMSSLLAMLTRLSAGRGEAMRVSEGEGEAGVEVQRRDGGGAGGAGGGGAGGGAGAADGGREGGNAGDGEAGRSANPESDRRPDTGAPGPTDRRHIPDRSDTQFKNLQHHHLQMSSLYNPTSAPSSNSGVTDSTASSTTTSAVNTASTTPTSEHPGAGFYDKILARSAAASKGASQHVATTAQTQDKLHASPAITSQVLDGIAQQQVHPSTTSTGVAQHA